MARYQICPTCSPNFALATFRRGLAEDCATPVNICNHCGTQKTIGHRRTRGAGKPLGPHALALLAEFGL